ncbi:response regulator [Spirosoma rigui]|uniref:response regulator n=1 Tax=Spirosoma rigui TaxID=564064 RepID=UPI0009B0A33B|nr:response regulator [Spirosoma rigui]
MNEQSSTSTRTIFIAEDEALILKMMTVRLQKQGYTVITAADGRQALERLQSITPDLVITDLLMPYHSGLDVVEYVKKSKSDAIPVLVLSASGDEALIQKARSLGANEYISKPFLPNDLLALVKKYLD